MTKRLATLALAAMVAGAGIGLAHTPASASITGDGMCSGLQLHSAFLDWGTGMVSVNVRNHTGDSPTPPGQTIRFKVEYTGPTGDGHHGRAASQDVTLKPSEQQDIPVFNWTNVTGRDNDAFQGQQSMNDRQYRFIDCIQQ